MKSYLGMYDFPEIADHTNNWYRSILQNVKDVHDIPVYLSRDGTSLDDAGEKNTLFIGQTCGWPLVLNTKRLKVVGIPIYNAKGCSLHFYRSAIIVQKNSGIQSLTDLQQYSTTNKFKIAVNSRNSCSGCLLLAATLGADILDRSTFLYTGAHERSVTSVSVGESDLSAIDCVSFELLAKHRPDHVKNVRVIGYTLAAPALPYVTSIHASNAAVSELSAALQLASQSIDSTVRDALFLRGFYHDHSESLIEFYISYIKSLQHRATLPSQYILYPAEASPEPPLDFKQQPIVQRPSATDTTPEEDRIKLLDLQSSDAAYINELLHEIVVEATSVDTNEVQTGEYSVWKSYGEQSKQVRLIFPSNRVVAADLLRSIQSGSTANTLNVVCFLGTRKLVQNCAHNDIDVVVDCWDSDAQIVARLNPAVVLAYATGETSVRGFLNSLLINLMICIAGW